MSGHGGKRQLSFLVIGILIGAIFISPAGAHVGSAVGHLWRDHIRPKVKALVYTKAQSDARFLAKNAKARNSDKLDGLDSTDFAPATAELWHVVGNPGEPQYGAPPEEECQWGPYEDQPSEWPPAAFFKDQAGIVHLRGLVKVMDRTVDLCNWSSPASHVVFVLPEGYRPVGSVLLSTLANGEPARVDVKENGSVQVGTPPSEEAAKSWVTLDGLSFRAQIDN